MKALVVQDDPNVQGLWVASLREAGHEAQAVYTEAAALSALKTSSFDLVLLDLCVNGRNSIGVATLATYRNAMCKVVVVSGSAVFSEKKLFAMSPAVAAALRKPVDIEDLMVACERVGCADRTAPCPPSEHRSIEFRR